MNITDLITEARSLLCRLDKATLSARYSDWYDWDDFLKGENSHHPDPLAYLQQHPREAAAFERFVTRIRG